MHVAEKTLVPRATQAQDWPWPHVQLWKEMPDPSWSDDSEGKTQACLLWGIQ